MKAITATATKNPREITLTLKQLSIAADKLSAICGYFFSWPVNPLNYSAPEWVKPLELIQVQDKKVVLCKVLDLDLFVNLYFMRWEAGETKNANLTFVLGNKENAEHIGGSLLNVINKEFDRKAKPRQPITALHQAIFIACGDLSLCLYSVGHEGYDEAIKQADVTMYYGEQTPGTLSRILLG